MAYKSKTPEDRARMRQRCEALAREYRGSDEGTPTWQETREAAEAAERALEGVGRRKDAPSTDSDPEPAPTPEEAARRAELYKGSLPEF